MAWFRATWQHGGAATGFATWRFGSGRRVDCVVKLPVGHTEYFWTKRLGLVSEREWDDPASMTLPTPRVLAAGFELGGYDLAWLVMERLAGPPLGAHPTRQGVWETFETAAEFHAAAITERSIEPERAPDTPDWGGLVERAREAVEVNDLPDADRWRGVLKDAAALAPGLRDRWMARDINAWCHHDLHGRNAMRRASGDPDHPGRCVLIDLAMVAPGHWVEDALYYERLHWGHPDLLCTIEPVEALARARAFNGLPVGDDYLALADLRRVLMAASAPAFLSTEADPKYLAAALECLETRLEGVAAGDGQAGRRMDG